MKYFITLVFILIFSALYVILKEKASEKYVFQGHYLFQDKDVQPVSIEEGNLKKNRIIIFDISDLDSEVIYDSINSPAIRKIAENSEVYSSTFNLSPDRNMSLRSFFECLPPYKFFDGTGPFRELKDIISRDLRNSTMIKEFGNAGYTTRGFFTDQNTYSSFGNYFTSAEIHTSQEGITESVYSSVYEDVSENILYYADFTAEHSDKFYMKKIDDLIGRLTEKLREKSRIELKIVLISTRTSLPLSRTVTAFYGFGGSYSGTSEDVAATDMSRKLMNLSKVKPKNYFGGFDIEVSEDGSGRDYFAGLCGDTLLLFDDESIFKRLRYAPEYSFREMKTGRDVTGENIGINEKYEDMIPNYFGGDYIKQIILKNATESPRNFKMEIKSRRRFEEFGNLENYYLQKSRKNKYSKLINRIVEPGSADTVFIYYAGIYQDFQYSFNDRYILAYGSQGINAGKVKSFDENSYYGMKYYGESEEVNGAFDIRIFNQRINY